MNRRPVILVSKKGHLKHYNHKKKFLGGALHNKDAKIEYEDIEKRHPQHQKLMPIPGERQFLKLKL